MGSAQVKEVGYLRLSATVTHVKTIDDGVLRQEYMLKDEIDLLRNRVLKSCSMLTLVDRNQSGYLTHKLNVLSNAYKLDFLLEKLNVLFHGDKVIIEFDIIELLSKGQNPITFSLSAECFKKLPHTDSLIRKLQEVASKYF